MDSYKIMPAVYITACVVGKRNPQLHTFKTVCW